MDDRIRLVILMNMMLFIASPLMQKCFYYLPASIYGIFDDGKKNLQKRKNSGAGKMAILLK